MQRQVVVMITCFTLLLSYHASASYGGGDGIVVRSSEPPPQIAWNKTYGGSLQEVGHQVLQTSDGGFIVVGFTISFATRCEGIGDVWLLKTDSDGNELWNKTFGGEENDAGFSIIETSDGGYVVVGETSSLRPENGEELWLIKTDVDGNEIWNKTLGGTDRDRGYYLLETSDGGYFIAGKTQTYSSGETDAWFIKTDSNGNEVWNTSFGGKGEDDVTSCIATGDGGYMAVGYTYSFSIGGSDAWLIKVDQNGTVVWNRTYGGGSNDHAYSIVEIEGRGFILSGDTKSYGNRFHSDIWLIGTDLNGNELWNSTYGASYADFGYTLITTADNNHVVVGEFSRPDGLGDVWLVKIDDDGNTLWNMTFGWDSEDVGMSIAETSDGGFILTGIAEAYSAATGNLLLTKLVPGDLPILCTLSLHQYTTISLNVTFTMAASATNSSIASWSLDVDDDGTSDYSGTGAPPETLTHSYSENGTYIARLTVTNSDGTVYDDTEIMTVSGAAIDDNDGNNGGIDGTTDKDDAKDTGTSNLFWIILAIMVALGVLAALINVWKSRR